MEIVRVSSQSIFLSLRSFAIAASAAALMVPAGCRAQGSALSPKLEREIALVIRAKANVPITVDIHITDRKPSKITGYDDVTAVFTASTGQSQRLNFLLAKDEKTLVQMSTFDIVSNQRESMSESGRPARGGTEKAPVRIVVYDDLQCPYCARMHTALFPALEQRYGNNVSIVYKDFPLSIHDWALHAAVDANCLADQSNPGYWNLVDNIHGKYGAIGKDPLANTAQSKPDTREAASKRAFTELDRMTVDEGMKQKVELGKLNACIVKQDETAVKASLHEAEERGIDAAPMMFVNGEKISGAVPVEYVWKSIDAALTAEGVKPPPPVAIPPPPAPAQTQPNGGN